VDKSMLKQKKVITANDAANGPFSVKLRYFWRLCCRDRQLILMVIIPVVWYIIFCYGPMYGIQIAFKNFRPARGIAGSDWVGFKHFIRFFESKYCWRVIRNTLVINIYQLVFGFPLPIIFAIMLNEVRSARLKKFVQSVTYFPHFISTVIVVSMLVQMFAADTGILNFTHLIYGSNIAVTNDPRYFRLLYVGSGIWQNFGFGSVLYVAAISGIDTEMYEAASIDGASRWKCIWHITLPSILPTIMIQLLLRLGSMFSQGSEKILLMYSPSTYEVADVISTYVYREGLVGAEYSYGAAVGLFNTVVNFIMLFTFNQIARKAGETSLW
jgi:putative aldouronate transport system permease protein